MEDAHRPTHHATLDETGLPYRRDEHVNDPVTCYLRHLDRLDRARLAVSDLRQNGALLTSEQVDEVLADVNAYLGCVAADLLEELEVVERMQQRPRPVIVRRGRWRPKGAA